MFAPCSIRRLIAKRHVGLIESANSLRIAIEHGEDADEGRDWKITSQGVRLLIATAMLEIRSVSSYDERGDLDLLNSRAKTGTQKLSEETWVTGLGWRFTARALNFSPAG